MRATAAGWRPQVGDRVQMLQQGTLSEPFGLWWAAQQRRPGGPIEATAPVFTVVDVIRHPHGRVGLTRYVVKTRAGELHYADDDSAVLVEAAPLAQLTLF